MNVVTYGGGTNSTAMIIGLVKSGIKLDLIVFADTGGERPDTYAFIELFSNWLEKNGAPRVTKLYYETKNGERQTLEEECLMRQTLPAIAFGFKTCSQKYKTGVADKFFNNNPECQAIWKAGEKINKYIGYDAGETKRIECALKYNAVDKKYIVHYPLYEWGWTRDRCIEEIVAAGLPKPGKSSCFFCPSMKKHEIEKLWQQYPDLFQRAAKMEETAAPNLEKVKGLGRGWSWSEYHRIITEAPQQLSIFDFVEESISCGCTVPCGCFD